MDQFRKIPPNLNTLSLHYYSIANSVYNQKIKEKEEVTYKDYLYVVRAILSIEYMKIEGSEPLLDLNKLIQYFFHNIRLNHEIEVLRIITEILSEKKKQKTESNRIQREHNLIKLEHWISNKLEKKPSTSFFPVTSTNITDIINAIILEIFGVSFKSKISFC